MQNNVQELIDNIVADRKLLYGKMWWKTDASDMAILSAFLYASAGKRADADRYTECRKYLQKKVNVFSEIRGIAEVIVITKMALSDDYEEYLDGVMEVYKKLRDIHKLTFSPYMVLAASNIYEAGGKLKADDNIAKLERVYKEMQADHPFLTGDEDRPFLATLVSRDLDVSSISSEIGNCYNACKSMSLSKEAMHTASQIMALSAKDTATKVEDLSINMKAVKSHKLPGLKSVLMPLVAALGLVNADPDEKAADIKEIYEYLKHQKGFKWYIGGPLRTMYSMLVYCLVNLDGEAAAINTVISTTVTNVIIEEIMTTIIIATAASSASHSASSGSN